MVRSIQHMRNFRNNRFAATCHNQTQTVFQIWVSWNSSWFWLRETLFYSGSTQFPYNPLTMRMLSSTPPTSIACAPPSMSQATTHQQNRIWEREPAPLLSAQYETLSDSDDWTMQILFVFYLRVKTRNLFLTCAHRDFPREQGPHNEELESPLNAFCTGHVLEDCYQEGWLTKDKYVKSF